MGEEGVEEEKRDGDREDEEDIGPPLMGGHHPLSLPAVVPARLQNFLSLSFYVSILKGPWNLGSHWTRALLLLLGLSFRSFHPKAHKKMDFYQLLKIHEPWGPLDQGHTLLGFF